jgi:RimJ/RimL family protein N-acetyltransferase
MAEAAAAPELLGARVRLRPFGEADITDTYLGWLNDPEVVRFSNQRFRRHDRGSAQAYLAAMAEGPGHFLLVTEAATGRPVGTLTAHVQPPHGTADMGILIGARDCWGRGYGLEAWMLMMDWLFAGGMRKVTAGTASPNLGMQRIAERSGMHLEGVRRRQEIIDGAEADILLYARFRHG